MMSKLAHIVIGLGFGDEGKGLITDYLCQHSAKPIVVRFNGGQQAGHTVVLKSGRKHIFSNFGSGTLRGISTFWSRYCTFCPGFFLEELSILGKVPPFFIDPRAPVTTHYDILYNRIIEKFRGKNKHGSCGLGFGETVNRQENLSLKFVAADLLNRRLAMEKLSFLRAFYKNKVQTETNYLFSAFSHDKEDSEFEECLKRLAKLNADGIFVVASEDEILSIDSEWETFIFEGAQGVLLDINLGKWPFVTKSNTTCKNAVSLLNRNFRKSNVDIQIHYVTRAYHTRHGEGPFRTDKLFQKSLQNNKETNVYNEFQGEFRVSPLDFDLVNYAIHGDQKESIKFSKNLYITCLDQLDYSKIPIYLDGIKRNVGFELLQVFFEAEFDTIRYSFSPISSNLH